MHERIHLLQQAELLILPFYCLYLAEYLIGLARGNSHYQAYRAVSFEREAFHNEHNSHYLKGRKSWAWLHYL
ncbi:hypothetical protein [Nafulsella turpanensis]|uniref:hypothetical protein n=1 Tax=Nafulsella turpanensis TaxID=1265690 RepID=UPI0003497433|nr:hypothetical protein [Nafulsella turpanensis]